MSEFITVLEESELQGDALRAAEANGVALVNWSSESTPRDRKKDSLATVS